MSVYRKQPAFYRRPPPIVVNPDTIERFLSHLRDTHPDMVCTFTNGGCYQLFLMLRALWPEAVAWTDHNHVWTQIGGNFYDINGRCRPLPNLAIEMDSASMARAHRWCRGAFWRRDNPTLKSSTGAQ